MPIGPDVKYVSTILVWVSSWKASCCVVLLSVFWGVSTFNWFKCLLSFR